MTPLTSGFSRVTIAGFGLIGGSWALALKRRGFAGRIVACDRPAVLDVALAMGAADEAQPDPSAAARGADLVILAAPVGAIIEQLPAISAVAVPDALVTDTGSTKRAILNRAREVFTNDTMFLGGHPLAGREQSGIESADANLFEKTRYVLTPFNAEEPTDPRVEAFQAMVRLIGAEPVVIDAEEHDRALAFLSHLPQLLSTALAAIAGDARFGLPLELAAGGFRDMTRLAESPHGIWRDVGLTNADNVKSAIDAFIERLEVMKEHLDDDGLAADFDQAQRLRLRWRGLR
jgi:prephenate dehydrogenase